jgi:hypothetical protein
MDEKNQMLWSKDVQCKHRRIINFVKLYSLADMFMKIILCHCHER